MTVIVHNNTLTKKLHHYNKVGGWSGGPPSVLWNGGWITKC